jgi:Tfp pilus assembly protein PilF
VAIELAPKLSGAHIGLGSALAARGQLDEAITSHRRAIELDPKNARAHDYLGNALQARGRLDEAIISHRRAVELKPGLATAHTNLGIALANRGKLDEAISPLRRAIELDSKLANAYAALGFALRGTGRFADARGASTRALELLPEKHPMRARVSRQLQDCERLVRLDERLPRLLRGEDRPSTNQERLEFARLCRLARRYVAATRFAAAVFPAEPGLASDLRSSYRYDAACCALLASDGQGKDDAGLGPRERLALRRQALTWLRADLAAWTRRLDSNSPTARAAVQQGMKHWQQDDDLTSIHTQGGLARLSEEERAAFTRLWADVAALLRKAEVPEKKEDKR